MTIEHIDIESTSFTVTFEPLPGYKGNIPRKCEYFQIGLLRVHARKQPEKKSNIMVRIKVKGHNEEF